MNDRLRLKNKLKEAEFHPQDVDGDAIAELAELVALQDDAIAELAEIIGGNENG